jgi:hypothetical protein
MSTIVHIHSHPVPASQGRVCGAGSLPSPSASRLPASIVASINFGTAFAIASVRNVLSATASTLGLIAPATASPTTAFTSSTFSPLVPRSTAPPTAAAVAPRMVFAARPASGPAAPMIAPVTKPPSAAFSTLFASTFPVLKYSVPASTAAPVTAPTAAPASIVQRGQQ